MKQYILKAFGLLSGRERWRWLALVPLSGAAALTEGLAAAAVFGLVRLLQDPAGAREVRILGDLIRRLPELTPRQTVLGFAVLVVLLSFTRSVLTLAVSYLQTRLAQATGARLSRDLISASLDAPYALHLKLRTADLIQAATQGVESLVTMVLGSWVTVATEVLVMIVLLAVLLVAAPLPALIAVALLATAFTVGIQRTRRLVFAGGRRQQQLMRSVMSSVQHVFGGFKELRLRGLEERFERRVAGQVEELAAVRCRQALLTHLPRVAIEVFFALGAALVMAVALTWDVEPQQLLPLLGLFAYAGFRLIPSFNRIQLCVGLIHQGSGLSTLLIETLERLDAAAPEDQAAGAPGAPRKGAVFESVLTFEGVTFAYEDSADPVLRDVSLAIERGQSVAFVGPTGAGKSTLLDLLLGFLEPSSGRILVDGKDLRARLASWQRTIGYVAQDVYLDDASIRRNIAFGLEEGEIDDRRLAEAVRSAQLGGLIDILPEGLGTVVGERGVRLSGGERQRVAIARALYHQPRVLVFDEATSALDRRTEREVGRAIETLRGERTVIVVAHRLSTVRGCDRLYFLLDGRLHAAGTYDELCRTDAEFRRMVATED